jgi:hypothetical protein
MSYTITTYDQQTQLATVADGTINTKYDISLIGKSYAGYGQALNENFVYLAQNFASQTPPPSPLTGQIWYDSTNNKLKFWDVNSKWHTVGSSTAASAIPAPPTALSIGDFWWDTDNHQLFTWNGTSYTLIGGSVSTSSSTQTVSALAPNLSNGLTTPVIQAQVNGSTVFVISSAPTFTLDNSRISDSSFDGFSKIYPGITLRNTNNDVEPGVTQTSDRIHGTATDSDRLGGLSKNEFVQISNASFPLQVNFSDAGYTVGSPVKLTVSNVGAVPTFLNSQANIPTKFQTTTNSGVVTPLQLLNKNILPGVDIDSDVGSSSLRWKNIYAQYVYSTASQSDALLVNGAYASASIGNITSGTSIVARDRLGNINVTSMTGLASQATALIVNGSPATADTAATANTIVARDSTGSILVKSITKTGTTGLGDIGQADNKFGTIYANSFSGSFSGNASGTIVSTNTSGNITTGTVLVDTATNGMKASNILLGNGSATHPSMGFISDSGQSTGFYWATDGNINIGTAGTYAGHFGPSGTLNMIGNITAALFEGTATSARYADLAEKYIADQDYPAGTVVCVGGDAEVTAVEDGDYAIGVVSTNPAYMMNSELEGGTYIALKGRVPVLIAGEVNKGDKIVAGDSGTGTAGVFGDVFAIALETSSESGVKLIECVIL